MFIRDGDKGGRGTKEWRLNRRHQPGRPRMPWTAARTTKMLRQCPLRHCAATRVPRNYFPNCCAEQSHKDNVRSSAVGKQLTQKKSNFQAQLHSLFLISSGLTWGSSTISLLLIPPGPAKASYFFMRVHLTSFLYVSPGLCLVVVTLPPTRSDITVMFDWA